MYAVEDSCCDKMALRAELEESVTTMISNQGWGYRDKSLVANYVSRMILGVSVISLEAQQGLQTVCSSWQNPKTIGYKFVKV